MNSHVWRPVALHSDIAREWLEPSPLTDRAEDSGRHHDQSVQQLEWYPVDRAAGRVKEWARVDRTDKHSPPGDVLKAWLA